MDNVTVAHIADALHFNPQYLMRAFKGKTGLSIIEYITQARIDTAKKVLGDTDLPIKEVAHLVGYCYGGNEKKRMSDIVKYAVLYGVLMGAVFTAVFILFGKPIAAIFLQEDVLIRQTGYFLTILCLSAPMLGVINMITSYFQALGEAMKSLTITVLRNAVLFIPGVVVLNYFWKLNGVIAAQPVVETILTIICIFMYIRNKNLVSD